MGGAGAMLVPDAGGRTGAGVALTSGVGIVPRGAPAIGGGMVPRGASDASTAPLGAAAGGVPCAGGVGFAGGRPGGVSPGVRDRARASSAAARAAAFHGV